MKLNLGCGSDIRDGYVNVDFRANHWAIQQIDLSVFPWPFDDSCASEILMLDFLEHFPYLDTKRILFECHRVLHHDGELVIQVPDAAILGRVISGLGKFPCNRCGELISGTQADRNWTDECPSCGQDEDEAVAAAIRRMFGGQDYPGNFHQTCFTERSLTRQARKCGLYWARNEEEIHQSKNWNFKSVFTKGKIW